MKFIKIYIFLLYFYQIFADGGEKGKSMKKKIEEAENDLIKCIEKDYQDDIKKILNRFESNSFKKPTASAKDKQELHNLGAGYIEAIGLFLLKIQEMEYNLSNAVFDILREHYIKRGNLEMGTFLMPFEYFGHKCGFERNIKVE